MKWHRINALLIRHLYLYKRSFPRLMDVFYWPIMDLLVWGFFSAYLQKQNSAQVNIITVLLGALIFWDFLSQSQKAVSVAFLEDVWERNLLNIFVTPLRISEFLVATVLLGLVRIVLISIVMGVLAFFLYHFNLLLFGFFLIPFVANLLIFGWTLGIATTAIILRYGTQAQILAFGFIFIIQPFSAVFYPISALPHALQIVAYLIPVTYVFEGMRLLIRTGILPYSLLAMSFLLNAIYLIFSLFFFYLMFKRTKARGALLKLE